LRSDPSRRLPVAQPDRPTAATTAWMEAGAGTILLALSALAAAYIAGHQGPTPLDNWGFSVVPPSLHSRFLHGITGLGSLPALAIGSFLAGSLTSRRDGLRAVACLGGPLLAAALAEYVAKPLVGRQYLGVLCYPSGTVAVVSAVATAWVLAAPRRLRPMAGVASAMVVLLMADAVVGLRWHYPSDALAGAVLGVGPVLLVDGLLHLSDRRSRASRPGARLPLSRQR